MAKPDTQGRSPHKVRDEGGQVMAKKVRLSELALARSGDKGDISDIGLMAFNEKTYEIIKKQVTPQRVKEHFKDWVKGDVEIYEMPNILSLEIVMHQALGGGATKTLRFDQTGKAMGNALLFMEVEAD
jgi:hypothetical protein